MLETKVKLAVQLDKHLVDRLRKRNRKKGDLSEMVSEAISLYLGDGAAP